MSTQADLDREAADEYALQLYGFDAAMGNHVATQARDFLAGIAHARKEQAALVECLEFYASAFETSQEVLGEPNREPFLMPVKLGTRAKETLEKHRARGSEGT